MQAAHPEITLQFEEPDSIFFKCVVELDERPSLSKTTKNFLAICRGGSMCKSAPNRPLHYKNCPVQRIVTDFVAQFGDVTGKGTGESIYGGKFKDETDGLKVPIERGVLAMANSGKNTNTSQCFFVLTDNPTQHVKLAGKYVVFGKLQAGIESDKLLQRFSEAASEDGTPTTPVWIEDCGVLE